MFGFNKQNRMIEGPVEFEAEVEIDRPASEVFPLIDITDPQFAHIQRGASVAAVPGEEERYDLTIEEMEGITFQFLVIERIEGSLHKVEAKIEPRINALLKSVETHEVKATSGSSCVVKLTTVATFDNALSDEEVAEEIAVMSMAVNSDLTRLKIQAEEGLEAVKEYDNEMLEFECDGIDFSEIDLDGLDWDDIEIEN